MKFLVVDDEPDLLKIFEMWFESAGDLISVESATSVQQAKEILLESVKNPPKDINNDPGKFSVIITDYRLPQEDGTELIKFTKNHEKFKNIPIILMSGIVGVDVNISYDNISFISKPFTKETLVTMAQEAIAKAESKTKTQYLDPVVMQQFVATTKIILENFLPKETVIEIGKPTKKHSREAITGDITAMMNIDTDKFRGNLYLTLEKELTLNIVSSMLFEKVEEVNDDVVDAMAELINIIVGNAKGKLKAYKFQMTSPVVVSGKSYVIHSLDGSFCAHVPFKTDKGKLFLDIRLLPRLL